MDFPDMSDWAKRLRVWRTTGQPPGAIVLRIEAHIIDVEQGGWCDTCLLPSVISATGLIANADTLKVLGRCVQTLCDECGAHTHLHS